MASLVRRRLGVRCGVAEGDGEASVEPCGGKELDLLCKGRLSRACERFDGNDGS